MEKVKVKFFDSDSSEPKYKGVKISKDLLDGFLSVVKLLGNPDEVFEGETTLHIDRIDKEIELQYNHNRLVFQMSDSGEVIDYIKTSEESVFI